jgi:hypothetical protein
MGYGNSLRKNEEVHWFIGSSVHRFKAIGALEILLNATITK